MVESQPSKLKEANIWVVGLDGDGDQPWTGVDFTTGIALVVGGEGRGLGRLVREQCDILAKIPLEGGVESLNASVACGIAAFEVARQRAGKRA